MQAMCTFMPPMWPCLFTFFETPTTFLPSFHKLNGCANVKHVWHACFVHVDLHYVFVTYNFYDVDVDSVTGSLQLLLISVFGRTIVLSYHKNLVVSRLFESVLRFTLTFPLLNREVVCLQLKDASVYINNIYLIIL